MPRPGDGAHPGDEIGPSSPGPCGDLRRHQPPSSITSSTTRDSRRRTWRSSLSRVLHPSCVQNNANGRSGQGFWRCRSHGVSMGDVVADFLVGFPGLCLRVAGMLSFLLEWCASVFSLDGNMNEKVTTIRAHQSRWNKSTRVQRSSDNLQCEFKSVGVCPLAFIFSLFPSLFLLTCWLPNSITVLMCVLW